MGHLLPLVRTGEATLFVNVGDHADVWGRLVREVDGLAAATTTHFSDFEGTYDGAYEVVRLAVEGARRD